MHVCVSNRSATPASGRRAVKITEQSPGTCKLLIQAGQIMLGIDGRSATHSSRGHRLSIEVIGTIPGNKNTRHVRFHPAPWNDVAIVIHLDHALKKLSV